VSCLRFISEGDVLLIGGLRYEGAIAMGTTNVWNLRENRFGRYDVQEGKPVLSLVHLSDQPAILVQSDADVELRDAKTWKVSHTFEPSADDERETMRHSRFLLSASHAEAVGFSSDGMTVSAALPNEGIRTWDQRTGGVRNRIPREASDEVIARSSNGDFIAETTAKEVRLLNVVSGVHTIVPRERPLPFRRLLFRAMDAAW
jgi:hypothetical protein